MQGTNTGHQPQQLMSFLSNSKKEKQIFLFVSHPKGKNRFFGYGWEESFVWKLYFQLGKKVVIKLNSC